MVVDIKVHRRIIKRKKYQPTCKCPHNPRIITVPPSPKLIQKGKYAVSFWAKILWDPFSSQRPLNRTLQEFQQMGLFVSDGTVTSGLKKIPPWFHSLFTAIWERNQSEHHWHADETRWMIFEDVEGKKSHKWLLWIFRSEKTVVFRVMPP